jgi:type II secretion system protein D
MQPMGVKDDKKPMVAADKPTAEKPEKLYEVKFDNTEWSKVFEWLEKETGLMYITKDKPTGTVTLKPNRKYTFGELIDLLNEALELHRYVILRKEVSFSTIPSDVNIVKDYKQHVQTVTPEELSKRGKTEIVQVVIPLVSLSADDVRSQVKALLSPFGEVSAFGTDKLLVLDKTANIRSVNNLIKQIIEDKGDQHTHKCIYRRASYVAETLRGLLKDSTTDVTTGNTQFMQPPQWGSDWSGRGSDWSRSSTQQSTRPDQRRFRTINITVDDEQNSVTLTGPVDKINAAKELVKTVDQGTEPRETGGKLVWKTYSVPSGTAEARAKLLMEMPEFKGSNLKVLAIGNEVQVYGYPADHLIATNFFKSDTGGTPGVMVKSYALPATMDAAQVTSVAAAVKAAIGNQLTADPRGDGEPGLTLRGSSDVLRAAEEYLNATVPGSRSNGSVSGDPRIRELTISNANSGALAEHLVEMMKKMGVNAEVNNPNAPPKKKPEPPKGTPVPGTGGPGGSPMQPQSQYNPGPTSLSPNRILHASSMQIADPEKKPELVFNVVGNKIVITGEDPKKVQLAYELMSVYTSASASKAQERYEVLRLKNVAAEDAAKVITEVFNGPTTQQQQQQQQGRGGGFNPLQLLGQLSGIGASAPTDPTKGRVRVVAEKTSNSLIVVKASETDLITIKHLLAKAINNDEPPEGGVAKTWIIPLQYAKASEMVTTIRNVFANYTGRGNRGSGGGGGAAALFIPGLGGGQQQSQPAALNVDYDIDSNQVVLNCTETIYLEVKKLCEELDKASANNGNVTAVLTAEDLKGVSPTQLQSFMDTLAGRQPVQQNRGFGQGGLGQGGFGIGGVNQFGALGGNRGGFGGGTGFGGAFGQGLGGFGGTRGGGFGTGGFTGGTRGGTTGSRGGFSGGTGFGGRGGTTGGFGGGTSGGGTRGGATSGGRGGRAQRSADLSSFYDGGGGLRPFEYRGTDSPSAPSMLFDPEAEQPDEGYFEDEANLSYGPRPLGVRVAARTEPQRLFKLTSEQLQRLHPSKPELVQVQATLPQPSGLQPVQPQPAVQPQPGTQPQPGVQQPTIVAPNADTQFLVTPDGQLVIIARNEEELNRIIAMIKTVFIPLLQRESQVNLQIVQLQYADSTQVVNELNQLFSRVTVTSGSLAFPQQQFQFGGQTLGQVILFPLPRYNAILLGASKVSEKVILEQIKLLDQPNASSLQPVPYYLKYTSAAIVQQQILNLFRQRYPSDLGNNIQVTVDTQNNAVLVQAGAADQEDIKKFILQLDIEPGSAAPGQGAKTDIKVIPIRNGFSDDMALVLINVLRSNVYNPQASATSSGGGGLQQNINPLATGGIGGLQQQQGLGLGGIGGAQNILAGGITVSTKSSNLRLIDRNGQPIAESGLLADVSITSEPRINSIVVTAPTRTMQLIESLVKELDTVSAAKSFVKIYQLKKMDATTVQTLLTNLFSRQTTGVGGAGLVGQAGFGTAATQGTTRPLLTLGADPSEGASLIDLRLTVDSRTNSIIVAGSQNDQDLVDAVIRRLEDVTVPQYATEVVKLKNAAAADVLTALNTFLAGINPFIGLQTNPTGGVNAINYALVQRQYFITAEPITNQLIIGATPVLLPEILRLIQAVDAAPPQVFVEVLIAEVRLNNNEEFGVEVGLQSDVLFARGGATATAPGTPGYNFNTTAALPNTTNVNPSKVGFQGLGNLGVGRASSTGVGVGGFVLSAASDSFSLLIRALKAQGRVDVLSRPTLTLSDNQTGFFQVGQQFPRVTGSTNTNVGVTQNVEYVPTGIVLRVTPRISSEGTVLMRVEPQISAPNQTQVQIAPGVFAVGIDTQTVETTVLAADGETVVLGGLLRKFDQKTENKIPFLGDLPWVGAAFRYRTQVQERREIVFIMTPRIGRTKEDMRAIFAAEAKKMSWSIQDAANISGLNPDLFRGKQTIDTICGDGATGSAPTYLPLSPTGSVSTMPVYWASPQAAYPTQSQYTAPQAAYPYPTPQQQQSAMPQQQQQYVMPQAVTPVANPIVYQQQQAGVR